MSTDENGSVVAVPPPSSPKEPLVNSEPPQNHASPSVPPDSMDVSPAPETAAPLDTPQSQPMTATASSSSQHPPADSIDANGTSATNYGTRSRNRTGGHRINYAEDKDLDIELEALTKPQRASKRTSAAASETHNSISGLPPASSTNNDTPAAVASTPSSAPTPAPASAPVTTKKRKHPGGHHAATTTSSSSRSKHTSSIPFKGYVETNMMSFTKCGYRLNAKQQLVANDGTTIQANGKHA